MFDEVRLGSEFFAALARVDAEIAEAVKAGDCPRCGGPLHRGDYDRKPRGGFIAAGDAETRRFSFCCGREGCRRRATPPSVRFLGRKVYVEAVVIIASVVALDARRPRDAVRATGVPGRTIARWRVWWSQTFVTTAVFVAIRSRFVIDLVPALLPKVLLDRVEGAPAARVSMLSQWLAPLTTASVLDGSRFVRGAM